MLAWLFARFEEARDQEAMVGSGAPVLYRELLDRVSGWKRELDGANVGPGTVVALEGDYAPSTVALTLALIDRACVVVPLTAAAGPSIPRFEEIAQVQRVYRFTGAEAWEREDRGGAADHAHYATLRERGHPGLILFSSGSTGEPKAAVHDFRRLLEKFEVKRKSLRTLTFLLLDHIGGLNTLFYVLSNTGTLVSVESRNPDAVAAAIARHQVELLPTSPTFLNLLLLSEAHRRHDLGSLKLVTYGTEPMPESTLTRVAELLPGAEILQTYGLSELGILRSKSRDSSSLWVKLGGEGFETKVVDGLLWIRARSAMLGYLNAPHPFDADGWFNTGDEVLVDGEWFRILGRRSELINVGGEKVYPAEVESVLLRMENVADAAVHGEKNPITGQMVAARLNLASPEDPASVRKRVREYCRTRLAPHKIPAKVEIVTAEQFSARFKKMR